MRRLILLLLLSGIATHTMAGAINWHEALKGIASGDRFWLDKAPEFAKVADVEQSQALAGALAGALSSNTEGALKTLSGLDSRDWPHFVGTDIVCMGPINKQEAEIEAFYQRTRLALLETDKGATCLWILEATYEEWKAVNAADVK
ncbi:hypothetical protein J3D56_001738 [Erwinia persicina]|jgi:hypothetical protein|uniref:hypothetical protein n=1 Tax=Erwinia persicina TaxID=55211 RepID=UPI00209FBC37|nr:hypothetical protein [Erwinia persicina]MCP1438302.1 hypothetical protein [Erwinia persicina]